MFCGCWFVINGLLLSSRVWLLTARLAAFGQCCCYCKSGSPVSVYSAPSPVGPWAKQNQIGAAPSFCAPHAPTSRVSALLSDPTLPSHSKCNSSSPFSASVGAQQSDIFAWKDAQGTSQFMFASHFGFQLMRINASHCPTRYYGDRWQSSPDGIKGHDATYFFPLSFNSDGNVTDMQIVDSFEIDI